MSNSLIVTSNAAGAGFVDGTTYYATISRILTSSTLVGPAESPIRNAGTFSNLYSYVPSNTASVTSTITLQKSQVNTAMTVSYTSDQTGIKEDTSNTVSFANTDEVNYEVAVPAEAGTNTLTISVIGCQFAPDTSSDCVSPLIMQGLFTSTASTDTFAPPNGRAVASGQVEANVKYRVRQSFTASNLWTHVFVNGRTTDVVIKTRKNGADGSQTVTYTSGQTGVKEDTTNTDSLSSGDDFNYLINTSTGAGTIEINTVCTTLVNTSGDFILLSARGGGTGVGPSTTTYFPISSDDFNNATEANVQIYPRFTFTAFELQSFVSTNTNSVLASDVFLRDNGANSSLTVSYAAAQTGLKLDSSNTATITSGTDEINYSVVNNDVTGTVTFHTLSVLGSTAVSSISPSQSPSASLSPSRSPSISPSQSPSASLSPSISPSQSPSASLSPSRSPSISPSQSPSASFSPSISPSISPSQSPSASLSPSVSPSQSPSASFSPSRSPSISPSQSPSASLSPSRSPSLSPSLSPSISPSQSPSASLSPSISPSISPSQSPSASISPSVSPSVSSSASPSTSRSPSLSPSVSPSQSPSASLSPSISPSLSPSQSPSASLSPSRSPSLSPSQSPSASLSPSISPSPSPSQSPSASLSPSRSPSLSPSQSPSASLSPSQSPSASLSPSQSPSASISPSSAAYGAVLKRWNGSSWVKAKLKTNTGSNVFKPLYVWENEWVEVDIYG